jgi:hypothetical protein
MLSAVRVGVAWRGPGGMVRAGKCFWLGWGGLPAVGLVPAATWGGCGLAAWWPAAGWRHGPAAGWRHGPAAGWRHGPLRAGGRLRRGRPSAVGYDGVNPLKNASWHTQNPITQLRHARGAEKARCESTRPSARPGSYGGQGHRCPLGQGCGPRTQMPIGQG